MSDAKAPCLVLLAAAGIAAAGGASEPAKGRLAAIPLPIFMLPERDRAAGNGIEWVYVDASKRGRAAITVVFRDEDHPDPIADPLYDAYRRVHYGGVRDIETLEYRYRDAARPQGLPVTIRFPSTYSRKQVFGEKRVKHHTADIPIAKFRLIDGRPVVYVNTWNHLFAETNTNPKLTLLTIRDYPLREGSRQDAEAQCRRARRTKPATRQP